MAIDRSAASRHNPKDFMATPPLPIKSAGARMICIVQSSIRSNGCFHRQVGRGTGSKTGKSHKVCQGGGLRADQSLSSASLYMLHAQSEVAHDLSEKRTNDNLRSVIGDNYYAAGVAKGVVASDATDPLEPQAFRQLAKLLVGHQTQPAHAAISTRSVPRKSLVGSSVSTVCR